MTHSKRTGWPDLATDDKQILREWITEGLNLVSVAKYGHGFNIDIDDMEVAIAKAFDPAWLEGYYLVDTPSGGLHAHGLHTPESEAMGTLIVVYATKGDKNSKKIVELKLHNQSVAAPTAYEQPHSFPGSAAVMHLLHERIEWCFIASSP